MVLAGLKHNCPPSKEHRRNILHEFGHALGLRHEHQGPAAQECMELDKESVKRKHGERAQGFLGTIDGESLWNYTNFDPESIMTYVVVRPVLLMNLILTPLDTPSLRNGKRRRIKSK